jgi:ATP-dependent exoDNAse (exonuclease V) alpha subunit
LKILEQIPVEEIQYRGVDEICPETPIEVTPEFMHSQTHSGMPLYDLRIKLGCPVMLLRNVNPAEGLSNGTIMKVVNAERNDLHVEIASGSFAGKRHFIPRIKLKSDFQKLPFQFTRLQFPVALAFAITINKSQGQTFDRVGIFLSENVFAHGQLYVALSRARVKSNIWMVLPQEDELANVVAPAVFQDRLF